MSKKTSFFRISRYTYKTFRVYVFSLYRNPQHSIEFSLMALSQREVRSNFKQIVKWPLNEIFEIPAVFRSNCKHITLSPKDYPVIDSKPPRTPIFNSIVLNLPNNADFAFYHDGILNKYFDCWNWQTLQKKRENIVFFIIMLLGPDNFFINSI